MLCPLLVAQSITSQAGIACIAQNRSGTVVSCNHIPTACAQWEISSLAPKVPSGQPSQHPLQPCLSPPPVPSSGCDPPPSNAGSTCGAQMCSNTSRNFQPESKETCRRRHMDFACQSGLLSPLTFQLNMSETSTQPAQTALSTLISVLLLWF